MVPLKASRAAILAVGTELTTGQVTNRNASWISEKLVNLGLEVALHEVVADDREMIRSALDRCASVADLLFVTGGLGPTTDDFTREVIADWLAAPLEWHEPSWQRIVSRLTELGIPVAESNRQQCRYPRGAAVLVNPQGTANGFVVTRAPDGARTWILPGPPNEVAAVWSSNPIEEEIRSRLPVLPRLRLVTWQCLGKSEAELGELTEKAFSGSGFRIGYRAHRPYVEIKVWIPESELETGRHWIEKLEAAIQPWILTRQGEDLAAALLTELEGYEDIQILDAATAGILNERLGPLLRASERRHVAERIVFVTEWTSERAPTDSPREWLASALTQADETALTLAVGSFSGTGEWSVGLRHGSRVRSDTQVSPWPKASAPVLVDRSRRAVAELAIRQWLHWLRESVQ